MTRVRSERWLVIAAALLAAGTGAGPERR